MKSHRILTFALIFSLSIVSMCFCDEGSISVCNILSYSICYDGTLAKILLPCSGDAQSLYLNIVDPCSLQVDKSFQFDGLIQDVYSLDSGQRLLVSLSELDGNSSTEEGKLVEIDYTTGDVLRTLYFDKSPEVMIIDPAETFAYIQAGLDIHDDPPPKLYKVSLSTFQIVDETIFGDSVDAMEISPDGSKLYVNSENIYREYPTLGFWGIGVFDTSNLEFITRFTLPTSPAMMEMNDDGSLLFISSHNYKETDFGADLYIVDTSTDQIINKLRFFRNGVEVATTNLQYSYTKNKLYCTTAPKVDYAFRLSNMIMELDLSDYSYTFFEMGDWKLGRIALAEDSGMCRLFAIENKGSPVIHYKDL